MKDFERVKKLGEGGFGSVHLVKRKGTDELYAMKTVQVRGSKHAKVVAEEIGIGLLLKNKYIPRTYLAFEEKNETHILMEYIDGQELFELIINGKLTSSSIKRIIRSVLKAIAYCHSLRICHRDIKPENVLVDKHDRVKLIDWGLGAKTTKKISGLAGTLMYVPPEMIEEKEYYCDKTDIWQIGVLTYVCLTAGTPFGDEDNIEELKKNIINNKIPMPPTVSDKAKAFILRLTASDPEKRPTAEEALKDPWLNK